MKLLLVEDEETLSGVVARGLRKCGYAVDCAYDGEEALYCCDVNSYDLIILDLNIPKRDGIEVLKRIRETDGTIKILILSARSEIEDRVLGLDCGANDYLIKPFDFMELEARIRTLLRITYIQPGNVISCGGLELDMKKKSVSLHTVRVPLTKKEYGVLEYLIMHKNQVVSAETLLEHVWDSEVDPFSSTLKFHIHSVKKKLNEICGCQDFIKNIRGVGYMIMEDSNEVF